MVDELERRGWLLLTGDDRVEVTDAGRYWSARYQGGRSRDRRRR